MDRFDRKVRAIDFFSGIGGWSLGLKMAGVDVINSYEWWNKANYTNLKNNQHIATEVDIRQLMIEELPKNIDIVVGSPPCTQFSFANRGGNGDIEDGLKDIAKFLSIVEYVQPQFWAMENIPRVANIIEKELQENGRLHKFAHLKPIIKVLDISEWGVPQRRKRCIVGNFDFDLLNSYRTKIVTRTLGDVVESLSGNIVKDSIYGIELVKNELYDHVPEEFLSFEEERMNREMKTYHPVYNNMSFPDPLNKTARTITATCTRVSRESVVIESPEIKNKYRRLTVRERGCLQSFPITYQFYGDSYSQKLKMIGNAIPPLFTFYVAQSMLNIDAENLITPIDGITLFNPPEELPKITKPDTAGKSYQSTRKFRAAIPHLRFKSGVRFELMNFFNEDIAAWQVKFFYGNSKNIMEFSLNNYLLDTLKQNESVKNIYELVLSRITNMDKIINSTNALSLQNVWSRRQESGLHPYEIIDVIGDVTGSIINLLIESEVDCITIINQILSDNLVTLGSVKILKHSTATLAGLIVCSIANTLFNKKPFKK